MRQFVYAALAAALVAAPAWAQQERQRAPREREGGERERERQQAGAETRFYRIQGEVVDVRTQRLADGEEHLLAKVRLEGGRAVVLDLGPSQQIRDAKVRFRRQQQVTATARRGEPFRDMPLLVVDHYATEDGTVVVIREGRLDVGRYSELEGAQAGREAGTLPAGAPRPDAPGSRLDAAAAATNLVAVGEVLEVRDVRIKGAEQQHALAKLRLDSGKTLVVDLGKREGLRDVKLAPRDRIGVIGSMGRINGKPVLVADMVGDLTVIEREDEPPARSGAEPPGAADEPREGWEGAGRRE